MSTSASPWTPTAGCSCPWSAMPTPRTSCRSRSKLAQLSEKARTRKISLDEMQGGCFSISNLGGIGGSFFTPIINAPEVAILGISRARMEPVYRDGEFVPRMMLPLSLSYDHRVIDGADGARFLRWVVEAFEQPFLLALQADVISVCVTFSCFRVFVAIFHERRSGCCRGRRPRRITRPRFWPPISGSASRWSIPRRIPAASACTAGASRRRRCSTSPSSWRRRATRTRGASSSVSPGSISRSSATFKEPAVVEAAHELAPASLAKGSGRCNCTFRAVAEIGDTTHRARQASRRRRGDAAIRSRDSGHRFGARDSARLAGRRLSRDGFDRRARSSRTFRYGRCSSSAADTSAWSSGSRLCHALGSARHRRRDDGWPLAGRRSRPRGRPCSPRRVNQTMKAVLLDTRVVQMNAESGGIRVAARRRRYAVGEQAGGRAGESQLPSVSSCSTACSSPSAAGRISARSPASTAPAFVGQRSRFHRRRRSDAHRRAVRSSPSVMWSASRCSRTRRRMKAGPPSK